MSVDTTAHACTCTWPKMYEQNDTVYCRTCEGVVGVYEADSETCGWVGTHRYHSPTYCACDDTEYERQAGK